MLVNYFDPTQASDEWARRLAEHRRSSDVLYSLFDYDLAIPLEPGLPLSEYRLPAYMSWAGQPELHLFDTAQGETDYNPFAYDVACLGNIFLYSYAVRFLMMRVY